MARKLRRLMCLGIILLIRIQSSEQQEEDIPHIEVRNWALKFGVDLWEFSRQVTKTRDIQKNYKNLADAEVFKKDGLVLVREMAEEVQNMMNFKINAVMKLMESAEQAAVSAPKEVHSRPKYHSSHSLNGLSQDKDLNAFLRANRHFDHLAVNTSASSLLFVPGVKDTDPEVSSGIHWSAYLDPIFVNNYESDPTLSWQYYGSSAGYLRRFPAMSWPPVEGMMDGERLKKKVRELHDFRLANWFVGAATSPKDIVILLDEEVLDSKNNRKLALATANTILDSLGPDDYINVYRYGESADEIVQCFKDSLVQASPQNIKQLKHAMRNLETEGSGTSIPTAFTAAFEILQRYNRTLQGSQCNQAIILITASADADSVPTDVIKKYNWPHMPVRLMTYLVGGETSQDFLSMACANKGYYARITNLEEIKSKVFDYVKILSRPMILYQQDHPIHWTPPYAGGKSSGFNKDYAGQLMTSVTAPILDRRNHEVKTANILGVVGTDVLIEEIQKLIPSYKLGINGYSFIVDNNGRILNHPDLRALPNNVDYDETLSPKYLNVDLSEVELAENDGPSHSFNNSNLLDLRHDMIDQKEGETEFTVKVHYDDLKRVSIRRHKYFYKPIDGTPFSLGIALPEGYGMFEFRAEEEIKHSYFNVTDFFKGVEWKVHPDWVYCEYHSGSEHWFSSPEERVLHFLVRTRQPAWKWMSLRPKSPSPHHKPGKPEKDAHFCDKGLMQSLVMDAKVTHEFGDKKKENGHHHISKDKDDDSQSKMRFEVKRSFIATRSGLFRWKNLQKSDDPNADLDFADTYKRAMDSSWYKRAVDQHTIEPESFVFSVPFDAADSPNPLVTATHAIFVDVKSHKAPVAVVGLQFHHSSLASHFTNITSGCTGVGCKKNCASEELDCYILDNNGFIIISERQEHTGKFFGEIDGTIMDSLVQDKIYRKVTVVDYQGSCPTEIYHVSAASRLLTGLLSKVIVSFGNLLYTFGIDMHLQGQTAEAHNAPYNEEFMENLAELAENAADYADDVQEYPPPVSAPAAPQTTKATSAHYPPHKLRSCEKKTDLYILQPDRLNTSGENNPLKGKLTNCHVTGCERPFSVQKIRYTNLILLVVDTLCPCGSKQLSIEPIETITEANVCNARRERLYRKRPPKCISYHPEEMEIKFCGAAGAQLAVSMVLVTSLAAIVSFAT